jgi:hypothetical protein
MKKLFIFLFTLSIITSCQKDEEKIFIPKNYLKKFQTEKVQVFDLDTLLFKQIIGKYGTEISFNREDFNVSKNEKITLELIELYDFKEILYRNINTVTTDNQLLETNGVFYISFKSDEKEVKLKENKKVFVYPLKGKLKDNDIFIAEKNSLQNIKWKITNQDYVTVIENKGGGVIIDVIVHKDSLANYKKKWGKTVELYDLNKKTKNFFTLKSEDFGWINIDRIVDVDFKINFSLKDNKKRFSGFNIYFSYDELKSFIYNNRLNNDLKFDNIPISGKTWITIIGEEEDILYYDKIELKKDLNNSDIILNMKEIRLKNLESIINN